VDAVEDLRAVQQCPEGRRGRRIVHVANLLSSPLVMIT
jgi:hypothetical protein